MVITHNAPYDAVSFFGAQADALDRTSLRWINAYNPGLSGAWMLQVRVTTWICCPVPTVGTQSRG